MSARENIKKKIDPDRIMKKKIELKTEKKQEIKIEISLCVFSRLSLKKIDIVV